MSKITMIYGPPGTGKTTNIVNLLKERVAGGCSPKRIGIVSFTRAASKEIACRLEKENLLQSKWCCTLHSMAFKVSGYSSSQILGPREIREFSEEIGVIIDMNKTNEILKGNEYLFTYGLAIANEKSFHDQYLEGTRPGDLNEFIHFCENYEMYKKMNGYIDFSDMLREALASKNTLDLDMLCVDEAQDLSHIQWELLKKWLPNLKELILAGDDDQSIFAWSGALSEGMHKFEAAHTVERIILKQSYRVPKSIQTLANNLIGRVNRRVEKEYLPREAKGSVKLWNKNIYELDIDPDQDTLIVYRNHSTRKDIEKHLIRKRYPYKVLSGIPGLLHSKQAQAIQLWERICDDVGNAKLTVKQTKLLLEYMDSDTRYYFDRKNFIPLCGLHWTFALNIKEKVAGYMLAMEKDYDIEIEPKIRLTSIHASKGMEAERVILINSIGPRTMANYYADMDNEIRTFYVGITRAKEQLDIVECDNGLKHISECLEREI